MLSVVFAFALLQRDLTFLEALSLREQVKRYFAAERWPAVSDAVDVWSRLPKADRVKVAGLLVPVLTDCGRVVLKDHADLIIPYRLEKGELQFHGHGLVVSQDLFTKGGRAAWAIGKLLDEEIPELNGGLTADEWAKRADEIVVRVKDARKSQESGVVGVRAKVQPPEKK